MLKIGITGSIGSGKSTVTRIFAELGVPAYIADIRAKELMTESAEVRKALIQSFGEETFFNSGELNRMYLATLVFQNKAQLQQLNSIVHPAVFKDFDAWCLNQKTPYIIKEAALMLESDSYKRLDKVIAVTAPEELRIIRTMNRDGISREAIISRMNSQMSEADKLAKADYELKNDEEHLVIPQVLAFHQMFLKH
jgi:dephospho-CoA kinase